MNEETKDVPPKLLDDFTDYCLYLSSNNVIEQRFSMEYFVNSGLADRSFTLDQLQVEQLEDLITQHKASDRFQSQKIKQEIEHRFLK